MLKDMLSKELIKLDLQSRTKDGVIDELISVLFESNKITDRDGFKKDILKRESESSTGLEEGIAIPHAKSDFVLSPCIAFGRIKEGIDFKSLDGEPSTLFFMIACPTSLNDLHVETLSKLSILLLKDSIREEILRSTIPDEVLAILISNELLVDFSYNSNPNAPYDLVGVVGCPNGIAHTYMCANSLEVKARQLGINLKLELNCPKEVKNKLTDEEIKQAKAVIIASDIRVETDRFDGKHLEIAKLKGGIQRTEELLKNAINQKSPIFKIKN